MADPYLFPSLAHENDLFSRMDARVARRAAASSQANAGLARRVAGIKQQYPTMSPTVILALAQAGLDPDDPRLAEVANGDAKAKSKRGGGFSFGSALSAVGKLGDAAFGNLDEALASVAKPIARTGFLAAQSGYEELQGVVRNVASVSPEAAGAGVGALLGSIVPGVGTAAGAGVGAALGGGLGFLARDEVKGDGRWEPQSSGAISLGRLLSGEKVDLGEGWLPNVDAGESETDPGSTFTIGEEQRQRANRVQIAGRSLTPGRLLAAGVVEPATKPYNVLSGLVDASVALSRFDPASAVLRTGGNVNRNRHLFTEAGGLFSHRPDIVPEAAGRWLDKDPQGVIAKIAATEGDDAFYRIWKATDGKLGADLTRQVADETDPERIKDILRPHLGVEIREKPTFSTFHPLESVRLAQTMPGTHFDPFDLDASVTQVERWLKNAKASPDLIARATRDMALRETAGGRFEALERTLKITEDLLIEKGVDPERARRMVKIEELANEDTRAYFVKSLTQHEQVPGMVIDGEVMAGPSPHLPTEFLNRTLTLPDARDIRRATSGYAAIVDKDLYKAGLSAVDFAQGQVWKRTALLRGAYTFRVIAEEQVRMAASGLDSLINHPLSLIAYRIGKKGRSDLKGDDFVNRSLDDFDEEMDEYNKALNRGFSGWVDPIEALPIWRRFRKSDPEFVQAAAGEIHQLAGDPLAREVARRLDDLDAVKAEFFGSGSRRLSEASNGLERLRIKVAESNKKAAGLFTRETADRYVDSIAERLQYKTGGQTDLLDYVATGKFGAATEGGTLGATGKVEAGALVRAADRSNLGTVLSINGDSAQVRFLNRAEGAEATVTLPVSDLSGVRSSSGRMKVPNELVDHVRANLDIYGDDVVMKRQMSVAQRGAAHWLDQATQWMFSNLMAERTNHLSRSPTFKQYYWQRNEELIPFADGATQQAMIAAAKREGMKDAAARMTALASKGAGERLSKIDDVDHIAKGFALDSTRDLLYDMTEKSQFFDAARVIFPFGEAWKEMVTRWARIGVERPAALRRGQQFIVGGRQAGFFYENANGEEVFAYPGSEWISEKLIGVPVPLTGRLAGLSLMTEVLPGVGPAVQFPAGAFIQDKPEWDWMRDTLFPFGEPDAQGGIVEAFLPAWLRKFKEAGLTPFAQDQGMFNGAVMDVSRYLASTGKYDTSTVEGINRLLSDASKKARFVYALRGAAQFFAPTAPTPEWLVEASGEGAENAVRSVVAQDLVAEYHDLLEKDPQNATLTMLNRYGDGIFLLLQGKTAEIVPGAPISSAGADWERSHSDVVKSFPNTFGFFAPGQDDDLDSAAFARQMSLGRRVRLTPDQAVRLANHRRAMAIYQAAKDKAGPRPNESTRAWLRQIRQGLQRTMPGFLERVGVPEGASQDALIAELSDAAQDDRLSGNAVAESVRVYLAAREKASQSSVAAGLSDVGFRSSVQMEGVRAWLRQIGEALVQVNPAFDAVWQRVFDGELADPAEEVAA